MADDSQRGVSILLEHMQIEQADAKPVSVDELACNTSKKCPLVLALAERLLDYVWIYEFEYGPHSAHNWHGNLIRKLREARLKNPY